MSPRVVNPATKVVYDGPNRYYGPAVTQFEDGAEFLVIAGLGIDRQPIGRSSWDGQLRDPENSETHPLYRRVGERCTVRIGDRTGTALIMQLTRRHEIGAELIIQGVGAPPFGLAL